MGKPVRKKDSHTQRYKAAIRKIAKRAARGEKLASRMLEHEYRKNSTARWMVKHLNKIGVKTGIVTVTKKEEILSPEQEGLRLRVQSRGFGDGANIPHSRITKYGKDKYKK